MIEPIVIQEENPWTVWMRLNERQIEMIWCIAHEIGGKRFFKNMDDQRGKLWVYREKSH